MRKIKVFETFSGIGTQKMALDRLAKEYDLDFEFVGISEVNQFSILSYDAIHNEDFDIEEVSEEEMQRYMEKLNIPLDDKGKRQILKGDKLKNLYKASIRSNNFGDISKIDLGNLPNFDLLTYSWPCTDVSGAGKQEGFLRGSNTRSSLLWECEKIIEAKRPKFLLMENVKALVSKKFKAHFEEWIKLLDNLGYKTFYKVLDAKDYGVPQHRERVFAISILDENAEYDFPNKMPLSIRLKDILEKEVDEKYYLSDTQISRINLSTFNTNRKRIQEKAYCDTLCARDFKDPKCVRVYGLYDDEKSKHQAYSIWDENGLSPTLDTMKGGGREPHIVEDKNYSICASRGRFLDKDGNRSKDGEYQQRLELNTDGVSNTLTTVQKDNYVVEENLIIGSTQKHASVRNDGISPTLTSAMGTGGGHVPMYCHNIKLPVIKRKYEVDVEKLKDILSFHKEKSNLTINEISRLLNKNKTTIEHYFRKDNSFAIPDKEIWLDLKKLLKIETNEFDESIMTFEVIDGVFDTSNRVYETKGISPTLTTITNPNILEDDNYDFKIRKLTPKECWRLMGVYDEDFEKAQKVASNSQLYKQAGNAIVVDVMYYIFKNLFIERKDF